MKIWKGNGGSVCVGKGSRTPRESPNHEQREAQEAERTLRVLSGGDASTVTHKVTRPRGSRPRAKAGGGSRGKGDRRADPVAEFREETANVVDMEEFRREHAVSEANQEEQSTCSSDAVNDQHPKTGEVSEGRPASIPPAARRQEQLFIWNMDMFSDEAIARDKARWATSAPTFEQGRVNRKVLEDAVEAKRQEENRKVRALLGFRSKPREAAPPPPPTPPPAEVFDCVHHMQLTPPSPKPAKHGPLQTSYVGVKRPDRKKRAPATVQSEPTADAPPPKKRRRKASA